MEIKKNELEGMLQIGLEGRLDTVTAPMLGEEIDAIGGNVTKLELDLEKLEYISSAGLRVILTAQKKMNQQGCMVVKNVNESVMEIFEITGFDDILTIE